MTNSMRYQELRQFPAAVFAADAAAPNETDGGAFWEPTPGSTILHFGDPFGEQSRLAAGKAYAVLPHGVLRVEGADSAKWLGDLSSQDLHDQSPGQLRRGYFLNAQGRILHDFRALSAGDAIYLITANAANLLQYLESMRFRARVEVSDLTSQLGVLARLCPNDLNSDDFGAAGAQPPELLGATDYYPQLAPGGARYTDPATESQHPAVGAHWRYSLVPLGAEDQVPWWAHFAAGFPGQVPASAASLAGFLAWEALRVARWESDYAEVDHLSFPHELDGLRTGVHLKKGCWTGQEAVARIVNLGKPPRALTFFHLDGISALPTAGAAVAYNGEVVGKLTTVANHFEDGPVALGLLKLGVPPQVELECGDCVLQQTPVVSRTGKSEASPQLDLKSGQWLRRPAGVQRL